MNKWSHLTDTYSANRSRDLILYSVTPLVFFHPTRYNVAIKRCAYTRNSILVTMFRRVTVHICRVVIGCNASTHPRDPSENGFRGCHSFSDIDMANVMLNHSEYCYYNPVVGMQNTRDESD